MRKMNQFLLVFVFYNFIFSHRLLAADSCVLASITKATERLKDLVNESGSFLKEGPGLAVRNMKAMVYEKRLEYLSSFGRFKMFDNPAIDQKIYNLVTKAVDDGVIGLEDAYQAVVELERTNLVTLFKNSDHYLGLRFKKLTSGGESLADLAKIAAKGFAPELQVEGRLIDIFENALLSPNELGDIAKGVTLLNVNNLDDLEHYLEFLSTLERRPRIEAIKSINELFVGTEVKSPQVKKFFQLEMKVQKFERKLLTKKGATTWNDLESAIAAEGKGKSKLYRSLTYACRSSAPSQFHKSAGKAFVNTTTGLKLGLKTLSFVDTNKDQPWDERKWRALGWELVSGFVLSRVVSKMLVGKSSNFSKFWKGFILYRVAEAVLYRDVVVEGGMYGVIVNGHKVILDDDVLKILRDPSKKKEVDELLKFIDDNKIAEKMIEKFEKVNWEKVSKGEFPIKGIDKSLEEIKKEGMANDEYEAFMEILIYSLTEKIKMKNKEEARKIYNFNAIFGFFGSIENVYATTLALQVMCMYQGDSKLKQYGLTMGITLLDSYILNEIYFNYRKKYLAP